ncbi:MAG: dihydropteroate synthase, partial [Candidatus Limnocylindrales bacterium]
MTTQPLAHPAPTAIGPMTFVWGERTFVMGILNITPDSFSGDGLLTGTDAIERALEQARQMVDAGADLLDVGGESTRPGHETVEAAAEIDRIVPVIAAIRAALPATPISVDTSKPAVAEAALDAGAHLLNDIWGTGPDPAMAELAATRRVPLLVMHNRREPRYDDLVADVVADLHAAVERAIGLGVLESDLLVDPGIGFGKT